MQVTGKDPEKYKRGTSGDTFADPDKRERLRACLSVAVRFDM